MSPISPVPLKDAALIVLAAATQSASMVSATFDLAMQGLLVEGSWSPNNGGLSLQMIVPVQSYNAANTVTLSGSPTGGTFTLTASNTGGPSSTNASVPGQSPANNSGTQTTAPIAYNATTATVQAALQALTNVGTGNATVSGSNGGPYTISYSPSLGVVTTTASATGLTGGVPAIAVAVPNYSFVVNTSPDGMTWTAASRVATPAGDGISTGGGVMQIGFTAPVRYVQLALTVSGTGPSISLGDSYINPFVNAAL